MAGGGQQVQQEKALRMSRRLSIVTEAEKVRPFFLGQDMSSLCSGLKGDVETRVEPSSRFRMYATRDEPSGVCGCDWAGRYARGQWGQWRRQHRTRSQTQEPRRQEQHLSD